MGDLPNSRHIANIMNYQFNSKTKDKSIEFKIASIIIAQYFNYHELIKKDHHYDQLCNRVDHYSQYMVIKFIYVTTDSMVLIKFLHGKVIIVKK